jgi:hypothetical protein
MRQRHSEETKRKIGLGVAAAWRDPEKRARLVTGSKVAQRANEAAWKDPKKRTLRIQRMSTAHLARREARRS